MKSTSASLSRLAVMLVILAMTPVSTVLMNGQETQTKQAKGVPSDWTHHHLVFSNPGTADEAIRNGTYERWLKISTDPRYIMQHQKRSANASSAALQHGSSSQDVSAAKPVEIEPRPEQADAGAQAYEEDAGAIEMSLEERVAAQVGNRPLPSGLVRAIIPPPIKQADAALDPRAAKKKKRNRIKKDWSETLGSNGTTGLGEFPATFATGAASCTDFAVFNTGLPGASGQANIIAYKNLYSTCNSGTPTVYWAYNTGGTVVNSVVLSIDGTQVAFVQTDNVTGHADLVVLKWAAGGTLASPTLLASNGSYPTCTAPCMISLAFNGGPTDTYSAQFVDYATSTAYVGDDAGKLHKFTNIFAPGTPVETTAIWPVTVSSNASLGSPVYDPVSKNIFVGDYLFSSSSACEPSATNSFSPCGYLYSVNSSTEGVTKSAQLDYNFGIMDSPIVDPSAGEVYVFVGDDGSTPSCILSTPCAAVYQFPVGFAAAAKGTEATVGAGYEFMMSGTFDNAYYTSSTPTGHLYVIGNTGPANNTLYQISINNNVMGTITPGPVVSNSYSNGYYAAGLQVNENYAGGTNDYIFLSVLAYGVPSGCTAPSLGNGCVIGYNVYGGSISPGTLPTGAAPAAGGTSGIVVDNGTSGAQNIYFSTLLNQTCTTSGGTGGCAIQTSQSTP